MKIVNLSSNRERYSLLDFKDEITLSPIFNVDEAKRFVNFIQKYKQENELDTIYIRVPGNWRSDAEGRRLLFDYLKNTQDYIIIETSPILRAYFKTELTINCCNAKRILKERK
ncbi:MAG: hypothetical protein ACTSRG_08690 [Candidatus Helarchaeota archaeon]